MSTSLTLTEEQLQVIQAPIAHYVVTAVAGSGKTTTLAHRIRFLLEQGISHRRILTLMFNRSAKEDFELKLSRVLTPTSPSPEVRTFHSMGYRLYKRFISEGYLPQINNKVLGDKEVHFHLWRLMCQFMDAETLKSAKRAKKDYIEAGHNFIEAVKNSLKSPDVVFEELNLSDKFRFAIQLFSEFEQWRRDNKRITYTDMLYDTVSAIQQNDQLHALVTNKVDIILVDEYQDTNELQHVLLRYIAGTRAQVTVVGDPDQTIYEFRGAKPEYIIKGFQKEFENARALSLSHSFRYGHTVSLLANHLINHNRQRTPILCKSHVSTPLTSVTPHYVKNEVDEIINILNHDTRNNTQTAILARVWSQLAPIELALTQHKMAYQIDGNKSVFQSVEVQSLVTMLELGGDQFPLYPPEIKLQKLVTLIKFTQIGLGEHQAQNLSQTLSNLREQWGSHLSVMIPEGLHQIQTLKLERFAKALTALENNDDDLRNTLNRFIRETDLFENIRSMSLSHDHAEEKISMIKGIFKYLLSQTDKVSDALQLLYMLSSQHNQLNHTQHKHSCPLLLTTIHRAKGLEWDNIIIPGVKHKSLPYSHKEDLPINELESERRLLYVGMTRAKQHLSLLFPEKSLTQTQHSCFEGELKVDNSLAFASYFNGAQAGQISHKPSTIIKRYAEAIGQELPEHVQNTSYHAEEIWFAKIVRHSLLGQGTITGQTSKGFSVNFEDNTERTFSKETADKFFTVLEH